MKLLSILCLSLLVITQISAIVRTEETKDWTKDLIVSYLKNYSPLHPVEQVPLMDKAKTYADAVTNHARLFGNQVDHVLSGFKNTLELHSDLAENDIQALLTQLKHQLRQLELKGQLTKERVKAVLDKFHAKVTREKIMTEAQWEKAVSAIESSLQPKWYQRVFHTQTPFQRWIFSVTSKLNRLGGLTKDQVKVIGDQLKSAVEECTDLCKLGDKDWVNQFTTTVSKKTQLRKDQLDAVIESITQDLKSYKLFACDYTGHSPHDWLHSIKDTWSSLWPTRKQEKKVKTREVISSTTSTTTSVSTTTSTTTVSTTVPTVISVPTTVPTILSTTVTVTVVATVRDEETPAPSAESFAAYWRQKELEAYRRLGYTEAQMDWIQDYLEKTFHNQKSSVKDKMNEASSQLKRYLTQLKLQDASQIDQTVHRFQRHLENWRTKQ
ncbi:hypothetical protein BDB01DRAFT_909383 [Pilobolus umbonatus]|nr:hypothetical protein BDB01DRAFT_909383 [Pilobolus umbonatus]